MANCPSFSYIYKDTPSHQMNAIMNEPFLSQVMEDCRQKRIHCDVAIIIKDRTIYAHKLIFQVSLPYFDKLFNPRMEQANLEAITIKEENIDPDAFEKLVKFAYLETLEMDEDDLQSLLICAKSLQFDEVVKACHDYLNKRQANYFALLEDIDDPIKPNIGPRGVVTIQPYHPHLRGDTGCRDHRKKSMVVVNNQLSLSELMSNHRQNSHQCDISIIIKNQTIYGHKLILKATIPYFEAMLKYGLSESNQNVITIESDEIDPDALKKLIDFIYTGQLKIDAHQLRNLLICANYFQLDPAIRALCHYINFCYQRNIHFGLDDSILAILLNYFEIDNNAHAILLRHFQHLTMMDQFARLTFQELVAFISSDKLKIDSECEIFEAVTKWIKFDLKTRRDFLSELLRHVRWNFIPKEYLTGIVEEDELIKGEDASREIIENVKKYHISNEESLVSGFRRNQRRNPPPIFSNRVYDFIEI